MMLNVPSFGPIGVLAPIELAEFRDFLFPRDANKISDRIAGASPIHLLCKHGVTHASLRDLEEDDAMVEIRDGKERLIAQLGVPVSHFAYPCGDSSNFGARELALAACAGFVTGVMGGAAGNIFPQHRDHLMSLPRCALGAPDEWISWAFLELAGTPRALSSRWRNPVLTAN